ncbi:cupin domain-containing protein [Candidatus Neomarinimicrobiota bacterium]
MDERSVPDVGHIIRWLRKQQGISLRALANKCGLSINAISRIERGEHSPTVLSLHRLATALDVPITTLFREETPETTIFVKRDEGSRHQVEGMVMESLGSGLPQQQLEPFLIDIEPGTRNEDDPVTHQGEEFAHCLEGEIEYCVGDRVYQMNAGDSLIFKASQPHYWNNNTQTQARMILVLMTSQARHLLHHHSSEE